MLSLKRYGWLCVVGAEVAYAACLAGGYLPFRTARGVELHHAIFETLPGFVWGSAGSYLLGALYLFAGAWAFAAYMVWMHNSSIVQK